MHSYKGTNNNIYHFNGDCSGDLIITEVIDNEVKNEMRVDFKDIIDIINEKGCGLKVIETEKVEELIEDMESRIKTSKACIERYEEEGVTTGLPYHLPKATYQGILKTLNKYLDRIKEVIKYEE